MKLKNLHPTAAEKELFRDYSMYLYNVVGAENESDIREYVKVNDVSLVLDRFKQTGEWPEYLVLYEHNLETKNMIFIDTKLHTANVSFACDDRLQQLIGELKNAV